MEIRSFDGEAAPTLTDGRTIEGYAVVFNKESRVMYDMEKKRAFVEVIAPGAVTDEMLRQCDIKALADHNRQRMLARSRNGTGTLCLSVDERGVKYRFEAPHTPDGDYVVEMVKRGDLFGSSFAYSTDERSCVNYKKRDDGLLFRTVTLINRISDVSIVSDPAYFGTDVAVRSLDVYFEAPKEDNAYKAELDKLRNQL